MKYFYLLLLQLIIIFLWKNSVKSEFYFDAAFWFTLSLSILCYLLYDTFLGRKTIKRIKYAYSIITSSVFIILFTLVYNYLLGFLYINYFEITGIKTPLFINNGFLVNTFILLTTIILIYTLLLLYIISSIFIFYFFSKELANKNSNKRRKQIVLVSFMLFFILATLSFSFVTKKYKNPDNVVNIIKHYLYELQYFDNNTGKENFICKNFNEIQEKIYKSNRLQPSKEDQIKVYPLFSENRASYVMKHKNQYFFTIDDCI